MQLRPYATLSVLTDHSNVTRKKKQLRFEDGVDAPRIGTFFHVSFHRGLSHSPFDAPGQTVGWRSIVGAVEDATLHSIKARNTLYQQRYCTVTERSRCEIGKKQKQSNDTRNSARLQTLIPTRRATRRLTS